MFRLFQSIAEHFGQAIASLVEHLEQDFSSPSARQGLEREVERGLRALRAIVPAASKIAIALDAAIAVLVDVEQVDVAISPPTAPVPAKASPATNSSPTK